MFHGAWLGLFIGGASFAYICILAIMSINPHRTWMLMRELQFESIGIGSINARWIRVLYKTASFAWICIINAWQHQHKYSYQCVITNSNRSKLTWMAMDFLVAREAHLHNICMSHPTRATRINIHDWSIQTHCIQSAHRVWIKFKSNRSWFAYICIPGAHGNGEQGPIRTLIVDSQLFMLLSFQLLVDVAAAVAVAIAVAVAVAPGGS